MSSETSGIQLIVGLGNIGKEYSDTRHNVGFWFADELAAKSGSFFSQNKKLFGETARVRLNGHDVYLLKPGTLMNRSGNAVQAACNFFKIPPSSVLVVHDDLDLMPGTQKLKKGGGSAGHNGIKSITKSLGTNDYYRIRIGIGHPRDFNLQMDVADFVLSRPSSGDREQIQKSIEQALTGLPELLDGREAAASKIINTNTSSSK